MKQRFLHNLLWVLGLTVLLFGLLTAITYFEQNDPSSNIKTLFDAFWYAIVTLTTVGYGDFYPHTTGGKAIGIILVLFSLGFLSYIVGQFTHKFQQYMEKKKLGHFGTDFNKHVIVLGWNKAGRMIVDQIVFAGHSVVILTDEKNDIDLIHQTYEKSQVFTVFGGLDAPETLERANIKQASSVLLNLSEDATSLVYLINLHKQYPQTNIVVSLGNNELKDTFYSAGATYVVCQQSISTKLIASFVFEPDVAKFTEDLMTTAATDEDFDIFEFEVSQENPYLNNNCWDVFVELKKTHNAILIGIAKKAEEQARKSYELIKNPSEETLVREGDYLILITDGRTKQNLEAIFKVVEGRV